MLTYVFSIGYEMIYSKKLIRILIVLISLILVLTAQAASLSPVGTWKIIDDSTGRTRSILKITETPNHALVGTLTQVFPGPDEEKLTVCSACKGEKHNHPIIGLEFVWGLKFDGEKWSGGYILDPRTGKIYRCQIKVVSDNKINVHGYIGLPILGITQTWIRV